MMSEPVFEVREMIREKYHSEAECARSMGWKRQRLNKITTGKKIPDIDELNTLAVALGRDVAVLLHIFLNRKSTNA